MNELEILHDGVNFCLYYQPVSEFGVPVVIKKLKADVPTPPLIFQLKNEWEQTHGLSFPGVRKAFKLDVSNGNTALYLQYVKGTSLRQFFLNRYWNLKEILRAAIQIARVLSGIHAVGIIHKDINPRNILVSDDVTNITLIDFGISTKLNLKTDYSITPDKLEGSLAYISPEQTGRMNRTVDNRSDLYSLGVTLYELLARTLPFNATDPIEFIYCHIASTPVAPHLLNEQVPESVSAIVMKLLEKNAESRYQSAMGLRHDLEVVLKSLEANEPLVSFSPGQNDFSIQFQIPQKLFGREIETAQLLNYFDQATKGRSANCFVTGFSGVGKSTLVHEIYQPITQHRGIFIEGKFDQYQRNIPYQAFSLAFKNFARQLLGETEQRLNNWKKLLLRSLGDNAGVITSLIPELELIIGKQEPPSVLGPIESQNRFNFTFIQFLKELASPEHPLVLFLDDLQSADLASIGLLKALISSTVSHFYFIGAYRDNEVTSEHPLQATLNELYKENIIVRSIQLLGLSEKSLNELVSDTLSRDSAETQHLSSIVNKKTDGNPYFVNEFLKSLYEEELIWRDEDKPGWQWDEAGIEQRSATENVVQFLTRRINAYSIGTLDLMKYASCIGNNFSASVLQGVTRNSLPNIHQHLEMMAAQGYLLPTGVKEIITEGDQTLSVFPSYKFVHDRFQQAVYSLIDEEERIQIHYKLGNYFISESARLSLDVFEIVNHLNQAVSIIESPREKWQLCELNYEAGLKARDSSAWSAANQYFRSAVSLLPIDAWDQQYAFTFNLVLERARAEFLNQNIMEAEQLMDGLVLKARTNFEKAKVLNQKTVLYTVIGKNKEAVDVSKQCLRLLNIRIPRSSLGTRVGILFQLLKVKRRFRKKSPSWLLSLPGVRSEQGKLIFRTISNSTNPAYFYDREYWTILQLIGTNYSIKTGNSEYSAFCYACYGILEIALFRNYSFAQKLRDVLFKLNDQYYSVSERCRMLSPVSSGISHWIEPLPDTLKYFHEGYANAMESGDLWYAGSIMVNRFVTQLRMGRNLQVVHDEFAGFKNFVEKQNNIFLSSEYNLYMLWIKMMSEGIDEDEIKSFEENYVRANGTNEFLLGYLYVFLCRYYFLINDHFRAYHYSQKAEKLARFFLVSPLEADRSFYRAITVAYHDVSSKKGSITELKKHVRLWEKWEKNCPKNFSAYATILRAELKRLENNMADALKLYNEAADIASQNQLMHVEALALELAGLLCVKNNLKFEAPRWLQQAAAVYSRWGARMKLRNMKQQFPDIDVAEGKERISRTMTKFSTATESVTMLNETLDLATVMKASSTISGEVKFDELLNKMMKITMENAGAQMGILFLERKELLPRISANKNEHVKLVIGIPKEENEELPVSLVQYVSRTNEEMMIDNAATDFRFSKDAYLTKYKPQSVLCVPVLQHGNFIGALYLENRLAPGVFTMERLQLIRLLSGQIAVSIENSLAYETLEQKVGERTEEISKERDVMEKEKKQSDALLLNILPEDVSAELKQTGRSKAQSYDDVTVLFADFVSFTKVAEKLSPEELLHLIGKYFEAFDTIVEKHGVEKIKTVGDAYICASGLPLRNEQHATDMVNISFEILAAIERINEEQAANNQPVFNVRIGLSSGPVIAGVIGTKKFAFDIWGDTVNTAARMQEKGEMNKINVSGATYEKIKDHFVCQYRGKIEAKNKGMIDMYFVEGRR
jgi:predicted ATPase/class 3 adenylate cyclase